MQSLDVDGKTVFQCVFVRSDNQNPVRVLFECFSYFIGYQPLTCIVFVSSIVYPYPRSRTVTVDGRCGIKMFFSVFLFGHTPK